MNQGAQHSYRIRFFITAVILLAFYGLGILLPEPFWATNNPGLLPPLPMAVFFLLAAALFSTPFWWTTEIGLLQKDPQTKAQKNLLFAGISILLAFVYSQFPMHTDVYGDAYYIKQSVDLRIPEWDSRLAMEFMQADWLDTKVGLTTFYQLNNLFTWMFGVNGTQVAPVLGYVTGGLFAFVWLKFTDLHLRRPAWKWLFVAVGLSSPLMQVFMGHYETYALSYLGILVWMSALGVYFKTESIGWLRALPFIFLLVLQTHITNWLLFPSLAMAFVWHYRKRVRIGLVGKLDGVIRKRFPGYRGGMTWSGLLVYYFIPAVLLGLLAYFVVTGNFDGPRKFSNEEIEDALFLPLYTSEPAPYDRYNLFSGTHFLDYLNLLLLWGAGILLLLIPPLTFLRKKINWNAPLVLISGATSLSMVLVFFVLNPLLSMGIDWDLYASPAMVVLPLLVLLYAQLEDELSLRSLAGPVLGLCLLGTTFMVVNASPQLLSKRLYHLGQWEFKTYWIGCSTSMLTGLDLEPDPVVRQQQRLGLIETLKPYAIPGNDKEYAALLRAEGHYQEDSLGNVQAALAYYEEAYTYFELLGSNLYDLTITHFEAGNIPQAFTYAELLAKIKFPPYKRTLKIAVHVSLAAREYQAAANYAVTYLNRWQDDAVIAEVERRLRTGDRIHSIVDLFPKR